MAAKTGDVLLRMGSLSAGQSVDIECDGNHAADRADGDTHSRWFCVCSPIQVDLKLETNSKL